MEAMYDNDRKIAGRRKLFELLRQNSWLDTGEGAIKGRRYPPGEEPIKPKQMAIETVKRPAFVNLAALDAFEFREPSRNSVELLYSTSR